MNYILIAIAALAGLIIGAKFGKELFRQKLLTNLPEHIHCETIISVNKPDDIIDELKARDVITEQDALEITNATKELPNEEKAAFITRTINERLEQRRGSNN